MSKTLTNTTIFVLCVTLILFCGCTSLKQKKRGIVFRGDWAFEVNRTPWVGHPGNTDIPYDNDDSKKSDSSKPEKDSSSWKDALLGPLSNCKKKDGARQCLGPNGNINITSYNPTIANNYPGAYPGGMQGGMQGAVAPGSLSLPPGAVVVQAGVLLPNGTILPHSLFFPQANNGAVTPGMGNAGINQGGQNAGQASMTPSISPTGTGAVATPNLTTPGTGTGVTPNVGSPGIQTQGTQGTTSTDTSGLLLPQGQPQGASPTHAPALTGGMTPGFVSPGVATPALTQGVTPQMLANGGMTLNDHTALAQNLQNALVQHPQNPMMINPATAQVMPGLSMTGVQAPGYPPIGYAPTGYSPGYAQQMTPEMQAALVQAGMQANQSPNARALAQASASENGSESDDEADEEKAVSKQQHVAQMPYPRFHPVPTHPVYQRQMGLAPGYQAVRSPMPYQMMQRSPYMPQNMMQQPGPYMNPNMAAAMQQQMMQQQQLIQQQQQLLMQQRNMQASMTSQKANSSSNRSPLQRPQKMIARNGNGAAETIADVLEEAEPSAQEKKPGNNPAPLPPTSKVLLASHQTDILQPSKPRVSTANIPLIPLDDKKSRK